MQSGGGCGLRSDWSGRGIRPFEAVLTWETLLAVRVTVVALAEKPKPPAKYTAAVRTPTVKVPACLDIGSSSATQPAKSSPAREVVQTYRYRYKQPVVAGRPDSQNRLLILQRRTRREGASAHIAMTLALHTAGKKPVTTPLRHGSRAELLNCATSRVTTISLFWLRVPQLAAEILVP